MQIRKMESNFIVPMPLCIVALPSLPPLGLGLCCLAFHHDFHAFHWAHRTCRTKLPLSINKFNETHGRTITSSESAAQESCVPAYTVPANEVLATGAPEQMSQRSRRHKNTVTTNTLTRI